MRVLVLGAGGQIARWVIEMLASSKDVSLTLYLRHMRKLKGKAPANAKVVEGDVLDRKALDAAVKGQDVVYANLTGADLEEQAKSIVESMQEAGVKRLIFIASLWGFTTRFPESSAHGIGVKSVRICRRSGKPRI